MYSHTVAFCALSADSGSMSDTEGAAVDGEKDILKVEKALSGRSTCRATGEKIEKGELRVGMEAWMGGRMSMTWQVSSLASQPGSPGDSSALSAFTTTGALSLAVNYVPPSKWMLPSCCLLILLADHALLTSQKAVPFLKGSRVEYCNTGKSNYGTCKKSSHKFVKVSCIPRLQPSPPFRLAHSAGYECPISGGEQGEIRYVCTTNKDKKTYLTLEAAADELRPVYEEMDSKEFGATDTAVRPCLRRSVFD